MKKLAAAGLLLSQASLPVPHHFINYACGSLSSDADISSCIRAEDLSRRYVNDAWSFLSLDEQQQAAALVSDKGFYYHRFYRALAGYIEVKLRDKQRIE